jgi:hypothetical protein
MGINTLLLTGAILAFTSPVSLQKKTKKKTRKVVE